MYAVKIHQSSNFIWYQKESVKSVWNTEKHIGMNVLAVKEAIFLKKINVLFIDYFYLGKYSFILNTVYKNYVFWEKKMNISSLFIPVLKNTASVSILFQRMLYAKLSVSFPTKGR